MTANLHGTVLSVASYALDESSNLSVSATSFTNVDATHLALQLSVDSKAATGRALVGWHGNVAVPSGQKLYFNLLVNGTLTAANDGIQFVGEGTLPVSFTRYVDTLVVGTVNSITLQAKITAGTATVYAGAGTSALDMHPQFWGLVL